jgi:hypothetical protein
MFGDLELVVRRVGELDHLVMRTESDERTLLVTGSIKLRDERSPVADAVPSAAPAKKRGKK